MKSQADSKTKWQDLSRCLLTGFGDTSLRVALLAAHPDDETIGASCVITRFPLAHVIFVTKGAPRNQRLWTGGPYVSQEAYAETRRQEAIRALDLAGVTASRISWLSAVDQEVAFEMPSLLTELHRVMHEIQPDILLTHPYEGGHPDHDSTALIARLTCDQLAAGPLLVEMTSYHARDGRCMTGEFLNSDASSELVCDFSRQEVARKEKMFDAYVSQRLLLGSFGIERERFRLAPRYDFTKPPHPGKLWYECLGWPMSGERWRELAAFVISFSSKRMESRSCA
jgi:LmbE family N-acetylglucosaminyl deacetylase